MKTMHKAFFAVFLAAAPVLGGIAITNENNVEIEIIERYWEANRADNEWEIKGTGGVNITLIDIQAPSDNDEQTRIGTSDHCLLHPFLIRIA